MMELVRVALRRPYTVAVLSLLVLLLGGLAVTRMVVDFFPKIDIPVVFVDWNYPGLSAEEMERRVVIISERAYSTTVNGIDRIESNCIPGIGLVKVFFTRVPISAPRLRKSMPSMGPFCGSCRRESRHQSSSSMTRQPCQSCKWCCRAKRSRKGAFSTTRSILYASGSLPYRVLPYRPRSAGGCARSWST